MATMRSVVTLVLVGSLMVPFGAGHGRHTEGQLFVYCDQAGTGLFALLESTAPGSVPNGVCYHFIPDVSGGFELASVDPEHDMVIGLGDTCPGPDWEPTDPESLQDAWLVCHTVPDFDVKFTAGEYQNGPGDEAGGTPSQGDAVIFLFLGDETTPLGPEGFVFHDGL